jgi:mRNA interferase RelE/StbE
LKEAERLDRTLRERVLAAITRLAETGEGDVKRLTDVRPPEYRLRVGTLRVVLEMDTAAGILRVLRVLPRGEAYR